MPLGIFKRKQKVEEKTQAKSLLEELCGDDRKLYCALESTLLLNPPSSPENEINSTLEKAKGCEEKNDYLRAKIQYKFLGDLSIYCGNLEKAKEYFKKCLEIDPNYAGKEIFEFFLDKERAEKAMTVAREYYTRTKKPEIKTGEKK